MTPHLDAEDLRLVLEALDRIGGYPSAEAAQAIRQLMARVDASAQADAERPEATP